MFNNGFAIVEKDGQFGYIDFEGKEVIPTTYEDAFGFLGRLPAETEGFFVVKQNGKMGCVDIHNEVSFTI